MPDLEPEPKLYYGFGPTSLKMICNIPKSCLCVAFAKFSLPLSLRHGQHREERTCEKKVYTLVPVSEDPERSRTAALAAEEPSLNGGDGPHPAQEPANR